MAGIENTKSVTVKWDVNDDGLPDDLIFEPTAESAKIAGLVETCHVQGQQTPACQAFMSSQAKKTTWPSHVASIRLNDATDWAKSRFTGPDQELLYYVGDKNYNFNVGNKNYFGFFRATTAQNALPEWLPATDMADDIVWELLFAFETYPIRDKLRFIAQFSKALKDQDKNRIVELTNELIAICRNDSRKCGNESSMLDSSKARVEAFADVIIKYRKELLALGKRYFDDQVEAVGRKVAQIQSTGFQRVLIGDGWYEQSPWEYFYKHTVCKDPAFVQLRHEAAVDLHRALGEITMADVHRFAHTVDGHLKKLDLCEVPYNPYRSLPQDEDIVKADLKLAQRQRGGRSFVVEVGKTYTLTFGQAKITGRLIDIAVDNRSSSDLQSHYYPGRGYFFGFDFGGEIVYLPDNMITADTIAVVE